MEYSDFTTLAQVIKAFNLLPSRLKITYLFLCAWSILCGSLIGIFAAARD